MKTKEQIERLNAEIEELKAEAHRWTETAKSLNRENVACIKSNGELKAENSQATEYVRKVNEEIAKVRKENAELKAKLTHSHEWINELRIEVKELKARWEELEEVIEEEEKLTSKLHDDFNTGSRAAYGVVLDMMGELSHKLLEQKKGMK
jgi:chromosome segregation ATPase